MFVLTVDQVDSRETADAVTAALEDINQSFGQQLALAAERTAGDEFQLLTGDSTTALDLILLLTRTSQWSVGCGVGPVRSPLPESIREAAGDAFVFARGAVERAKRRPTRFALEGDTADTPDAEALIDLLLILRSRRSAEGWELYDLVRGGLTQADAAEKLGITPQAASARAQAAELKAEFAVTAALGKILYGLDEPFRDEVAP
jgi:hypothetical protein